MIVYPLASDWADDGWTGDGSEVDGGVATIWNGDGHGTIDACEAADIIEQSMEGQDYSQDVEGVTGAEYRNSDLDCDQTIIGGANIVVAENEELSAGAAFGILAAAVALIALLFMLANKMRRKSDIEEMHVIPEDNDMSLISNDLDGDFFEESGMKDDPYANTIDVHKCTSIYCNCNKNAINTTFLPVPRKVNMAKTMAAHGIDVDSPTGVTALNESATTYFDQAGDDGDEEELINLNDMPASEEEMMTPQQGSIMRAPISPHFDNDRPLTPLMEVAHDSDIDTELESVAEYDDITMDDSTVPPPPPMSMHPTYGQGSDQVNVTRDGDSDSEVSI